MPWRSFHWPGYMKPETASRAIRRGLIFGTAWPNGAARESNFHDYEMLRIDECPKIETHIVNSGEPLGGAGEPGTPAIAPALANAIFDATGARVRALPIKNYDFNFRIEETDEVG